MAKVILITSRVFDQQKKWTSIELKSITVDSQFNSIVQDCYLAAFFDDLFPVCWKLEASPLKEFARKNASNVSELKQKVEKSIIPHVKNKGGGNFVFGIFKKDLPTSNVSVYFANEFPLDSYGSRANDENKYCYLNAILNEICENENITVPNTVDWEIISHDKDWGEKAYSNCYLNKQSSDPDKKEIKEYFDAIKNKIKQATCPKLYDIVNNAGTRIQLFQHDANVDDAYLYIQKMISEDEYAEDFTTFMEGTKNNNDLFNAIVEAKTGEDRLKKIEEFIDGVNPNYGIFPQL